MSRISNIISTMAVVLAALSVASCSSDTPEQDAARPILFGGQSTDDIILDWSNGRPMSRDAADNKIKSITPDNIGVFAFGDGPNTTYIFRNQKVYWKQGKEFNNAFAWEYADNYWPYTVNEGENVQRPWEKMRYRFFAYSPWYPLKNVNVTAENYSGFNAFTWDEVPGFSDKDFVLANEIAVLDNSDGSYKTGVPTVKFSMRHILARLRFFFRTSEEYHQIRRIRIDNITILTAGKVKSATFNFKNDAWDQIVHWSSEAPGDADPVTLTSHDGADYLLSTDYLDEPFNSIYVYPQAGFDELKMKIEYTVFDSEGLVARTASVTNTFTLPNWTLLSGYYYNLYINIVPSYLYILSDNDQDFDGFVIIKDTTAQGS